jgi:hypothetical protein
MVGALSNLEFSVSASTVRNILKRRGIDPSFGGTTAGKGFEEDGAYGGLGLRLSGAGGFEGDRF